MRVVTFGSDHPLSYAALRTVERLDGFDHVDHVSTTDDREFLRKPNTAEARAYLRSLEPDLFLSAAYGRILGEQTLGLASIGAVNVHPSLLPRFRGVNAVQWAMYEGESRVGLTIHEMVPAVDSGAVLAQITTPIREGESARDVYLRLGELLPPTLTEVLTRIRRTGTIEGRPQRGEGSYRRASRLELDRLELDWSWSAAELARRFRVFPWHCNLPVGPWRIFLRDVEPRDAIVKRPPGTMVRRRPRTLDVVVADGTLVRLHLDHALRAWTKLALVGLRTHLPHEP